MHWPAKQKAAAGVASFLMLGGVAFVGNQWARPATPLDLTPLAPPHGSVAVSQNSTVAPMPPVAPKEVCVDVSGSVKKGGLYRLPPDSRVDDALKAAGGASAEANLDAINLAAKVVDGDQIFVPRKSSAPEIRAETPQRVAERYRGGEIRSSYSVRPIEPSMPPTLTGTPDSTSRHPAKAKAAGPVSLSVASLETLQTIPGIGPATAQKIVDYRLEHGGFATIEEVRQIKGIGPKKFEKMKPFLQP